MQLQRKDINNISKKLIFFGMRFEKVLLIICFHCKIRRPKKAKLILFFFFFFFNKFEIMELD